MSTDVLASLAASLNAGLDKDEAKAEEAQQAAKPPWLAANSLLLIQDDAGVYDVEVAAVSDYRYDAVFLLAARHDPARALREVTVMRSLIAAILAEPHDFIPGDSWYSCSQAVVPVPADDEDRIPGSGCLDDSRRGQPCDCGRDARAERLLSILAGIYDETGEQQR